MVKKENNKNRNLIIAIALVVLVVVAAIQAFQFFGLKSKLSAGKVNIKTGSASQQINTNTGASSIPTTDVLPEMVGGC